jgi:peptidyl-prolyl cis-trans isomerase B (cyclophilin B)
MLLIVMLTASMAGCRIVPDEIKVTKPPEGYIDSSEALKDIPNVYTQVTKNPIAVFILEDDRRIEVELFPDKAPNTVSNFIYLANEKKFFDNTTFHKVFPDYLVQGGSPDGTDEGTAGYYIEGEFPENDFEQNDLKHNKGVISMIRDNYDNNSASSQFFFCLSDNAENLDGKYAAFGATTVGLDVVTSISNAVRDNNNLATEPVKIKMVRVDTRGIDYLKPDTIPIK